MSLSNYMEKNLEGLKKIKATIAKDEREEKARVKGGWHRLFTDKQLKKWKAAIEEAIEIQKTLIALDKKIGEGEKRIQKKLSSYFAEAEKQMDNRLYQIEVEELVQKITK